MEKIKDLIAQNKWEKLSRHPKLKAKHLRLYKDKLNWDYTSQYFTFNRKLLEEFADYINYITISFSQKLDDDFIDEHCDKLHWPHISQFQNLSKKMIEKHKDRLDHNLLRKHNKNYK